MIYKAHNNKFFKKIWNLDNYLVCLDNENNKLSYHCWIALDENDNVIKAYLKINDEYLDFLSNKKVRLLGKYIYYNFDYNLLNSENYFDVLELVLKKFKLINLLD